MNSRKWTTTLVTMASVAVTLATASVGFSRMIIPGTRPLNDPLATPTGGGGGGGLPPEQPGYPPRQPYVTGPGSRTTTTLTVGLHDRSSYETGYELYRGPSATGPWTSIATFAPFSGQKDYRDTGLSKDMRYYYRLRAYNTYGETFGISSPLSTLAGKGVSRLQIRLRTANVTDAGTDDSVAVSTSPHNMTWLDYGRNDFERNDTFTYEMLVDGVSDLADIGSIYIEKMGFDGWCLASLALLVNDVEVYNEFIGNTPSTCRWIDQEPGHQHYYGVSHATLRAHPLWQYYMSPVYQEPVRLPLLTRQELEARIEGILGDVLHDPVYVPYWGAVDPYWGYLYGDRYVEVSQKKDVPAGAQVLDIDIDLGVDGPVDVDVDINFDLRFEGSCRVGSTPPRLRIIPENVRASTDFSWVTEALTIWLINFAEGPIADVLEENLTNILKTLPSLDFDLDQAELQCISPLVNADGSVYFALTFAPPPPPPPPTGGTLPTRTGITRGTTTGTFTRR